MSLSNLLTNNEYVLTCKTMNCTNMTTSDAINCQSLTVSGPISSQSLAVSSDISCNNLSASNQITSNVLVGSTSVLGAITCNSVGCSGIGTYTGSLSSSSLSTGFINTSGLITGNSIASNSTITSVGSITASGAGSFATLTTSDGFNSATYTPGGGGGYWKGSFNSITLSGTGSALTEAQIVGKCLYLTGTPSGDYWFTMPSAGSIISALSPAPAVGDIFELLVINSTFTFTVSFITGSGITLYAKGGVATIQPVDSGRLRFIVTNVTPASETMIMMF